MSNIDQGAPAAPAADAQPARVPEPVTLEQYVIEKGIGVAELRHTLAVHSEQKLTMASQDTVEHFDALFAAATTARV